MLKLVSQTETPNGGTVELFQTDFGYAVRYGLDVRSNLHIADAVIEYQNCIAHALACAGHFTDGYEEE